MLICSDIMSNTSPAASKLLLHFYVRQNTVFSPEPTFLQSNFFGKIITKFKFWLDKRHHFSVAVLLQA